MIRDPTTAHLVHSLFEAAALAIGTQYYIVIRRHQGQGGVLEGPGFAVLAGCLLGAALGNKLVFWIEMPHLWTEHGGWLGFFLGGQSVVGGLLGGLVGVELGKKLSGQTRSTGDLFVFPILLGLIIGRIGCFLAGLNDGTFGVETALPWGVDFGDGIRRHPTQVYEIAFAIVGWIVLRTTRTHLAPIPGLLFKLMLSSYLLWRLAIETIKPIPYAYPLGLSGIQWICLITLIIYLPLVYNSLCILLRPTSSSRRMEP